MKLFDILLFLAKYIPFWAIPLGLTSMHFCYLFWLKDYRDIAYVWGGLVFFSAVAIAFYFVLGGPDQMAKILTQTFH